MTDTTPEAEAIQLGILRRMSGADRLKLAFEMSLMARELAATRLRHEHPDWSTAMIQRELLRYAFGSAPLPPFLR